MLLQLGKRVAGLVYSHEEVVCYARMRPAEPPPSPPVGYQSAARSEVWALKKENRTWTAEEQRRREQNADVCHAVIRQGQALHYTWLTTSQRTNTELGFRLTPLRGEAWLYDAYTRPSHRGQGLYAVVLGVAAHAFLESKGQVVWVEALARNRASRIGIERAGFQYAGSVRRVTWFGMFSWRRFAFSEDDALAGAFRRQNFEWD